MTHLYKHNHKTVQWSTGGAYLFPLHDLGSYKLVMGVECQLVAIEKTEMALLDTGSELSVIGENAYQLFLHKQVPLISPVGTRRINTRLGSFEGTLYRVEVVLKADWGENLLIDGTFLFCEYWTGPTVLGFHGFLERVRLAIEPDYEKIGCVYFAATEL